MFCTKGEGRKRRPGRKRPPYVSAQAVAATGADSRALASRGLAGSYAGLTVSPEAGRRVKMACQILGQSAADD